MADIVLKDKNGSPVTYEGVTEINLTNASGETEKFETPFLSRMIYMYSYKLTDTDGVYEIVERSLFVFTGNTGLTAIVSSAYVEEHGKLGADGIYRLNFLFSTNPNLEVGKTYTSSQLLNG